MTHCTIGTLFGIESFVYSIISRLKLYLSSHEHGKLLYTTRKNNENNYFHLILQCQEAVMDTLFWDTSLRLYPFMKSGILTAQQTDELDLVFSQGLIALSLNGNEITDSGLGFIRRALRCNHWILGEIKSGILVQDLFDNWKIQETSLRGDDRRVAICTTLYCTTLHYTTLHYTTLHYTTLHYT